MCCFKLRNTLGKVIGNLSRLLTKHDLKGSVSRFLCLLNWYFLKLRHRFWQVEHDIQLWLVDLLLNPYLFDYYFLSITDSLLVTFIFFFYQSTYAIRATSLEKMFLEKVSVYILSLTSINSIGFFKFFTGCFTRQLGPALHSDRIPS